MIKVLGLALYGPLAASNRYRLGYYTPGLAELGIDLQVRHLLGDAYLNSKFTRNGIPLASIFREIILRFYDLLHQHDYDLVIVQGELIPLAPAWLEQVMLRVPYIYDFDDAFYLKYRTGLLSLASPVLGRKFDNVIAKAEAVTAGSYILADYAAGHNLNTYYLPTVVDTKRYLPDATKRNNSIFTIGWIGSPSTAPYLDQLIEPLSLLGLEGEVRLLVVGARAPVISNVSAFEIEWHEDTEIALINSFDVGVMPLSDGDWERGKCAFKLIQYMACALPVVASPVGANLTVVNNVSGFFASSSAEWLTAFRRLRDDSDLRNKMGQAGRDRVIREYSINRNLPILAEIICRAIGRI